MITSTLKFDAVVNDALSIQTRIVSFFWGLTALSFTMFFTGLTKRDVNPSAQLAHDEYMKLRS